MREMKVKEDGVPEGQYKFKFIGVEDFDKGDFGPSLKWRFEVVEGRYSGIETSRLTKPSPSSRNSCGFMLKQLTGKELKLDFDYGPVLEKLEGQYYIGSVEKTDRGNLRVGAITRCKADTPAPDATSFEDDDIPF